MVNNTIQLIIEEKCAMIDNESNNFALVNFISKFFVKILHCIESFLVPKDSTSPISFEMIR